jgi:hypothetical protein
MQNCVRWNWCETLFATLATGTFYPWVTLHIERRPFFFVYQHRGRILIDRYTHFFSGLIPEAAKLIFFNNPSKG